MPVGVLSISGLTFVFINRRTRGLHLKLIAIGILALVVGAMTFGLAMAGNEPAYRELGDQAADQIRAAYQADTIEERNRLVDQALDTLQVLINDPDSPETVIRRSRFDRVAALRVSEQMDAVIDTFQALERDGIEMPPYVLEAAADARLHRKEPGKAEHLYRRILDTEPDAPNPRMGLFYALMEQEDFSAAIEVIDESVHLTADEPGSWHWFETRTTAAMARAYANRHDLALERLEALRDEYPENARILRELATVYRWRGWPERALETVDQAKALEPGQIGIRLLKANILNDLGDFAEVDERLGELYAANPENLHVARDHEAWLERRRWSMHAHGEYGDSSGSSASPLGSRDRSWGVRLNAPWLGHHLQPYFLYDYSDARLPEGEADYDRIGAGISWRGHGQHTYAQLNRNRTGQAETGLTLGYDGRFNDHWHASARYESFSTDVPLRARFHDIDGWKAEVGMRWQAHESLGVRANLTRLDLSDGNVRWSGLVSHQHRLRASAHHITSGNLDLYASRASQEGGPYFNPSRDGSLTYVIDHDWLTWRKYDQSFTQRFVVGGGGYWQEGFGTHLIGLGRYEHQWRFNPRWQIHYGIGVASRVYDGERERRIHARLALQGVF